MPWNSDEAFVAIEQGLSVGVLRKLEACVPSVTPMVPALLGSSARTLARRRSQGRLTPVESDRLFRLVALYAQAADVLGSLEAADEMSGCTAPQLRWVIRHPSHTL
jgi:putative toxin-antitoxin system antitoxin component (TIGR02293 family)